MRRSVLFLLCSTGVLGAVASLPGHGLAQLAVDGGTVGYELALAGATATERGSALYFTGIAYESTGAVGLDATAGLEIETTLDERSDDGRSWVTVSRRTVRSGTAGRFEVAVDVPEEDLTGPRVVFRVRRPGAPGRSFAFEVRALAARRIDLLTDRQRYEPGETVHVWARVRSVRRGEPMPDRAVVVRVTDPDGAEIFHDEVTTRASGSISLDVALPGTAETGRYTVTCEEGTATEPATRVVEVLARTTERMMAAIVLDDDLVEPGAPVRGLVRVTDPSGAPIPGARVELTTSYAGDPIALETGHDGTVRFEGRAPTWIDGDVGWDQVLCRAVHPSAGSATALSGYTIARTAWLVTATPENGALVPEVDARLFLAVTDPRSMPNRDGVELEVRGLAIPGGRVTTTADHEGLAEIVIRVPRGAAARMDGGDCAGSTSTSLEVELHTTPPVVATVCAEIALEADVLPRARWPVATPGEPVEIELARRPGATGPVLVELLYGERTVTSVVTTGSTASLVAPRDLQGVLWARARVVSADDRRAPVSEEGATLLGDGARTAIVVRPDDAFVVDVRAAARVGHVREHASVDVTTSIPPSDGGWATFVARDEAQHGGEGDYALETLEGELRASLGPTMPAGNERLVRVALAGMLVPEPEVEGPPPISPEPWEVAIGRYGGGSLPPGVLRDPIALREAMLRTASTRAMLALEALVTRLSGLDPETRARAATGRGARLGFGPDAMSLAGLPSEITLGGLPLTPAHLSEVDPSFDFDTVARRVARSRLVLLLLALERLGSPSDEAALRATAGHDPDRWLSLLVRLGMIRADQLRDPWGRTYELRRVTGRGPVVVFSERAAAFELASPGPDGVLGNGDDVRDPFARVIPEGTPYAVASGEDELLRRLSRIAPGSSVLQAMAMAYAELGLGAEEERRSGALVATTSEDSGEVLTRETYNGLEDGRAIDDLLAGALGGGRGGEGDESGGSTRGPVSGTTAYAYDFESTIAADPMPEEPARADWWSANADAPVEAPPPPPSTPAATPSAALAAVVREDFPATLFFAGEIPLDATGRATIDVPLADAITTYRLEAIVWSASGWTSSGRGSLRVEQEAEIDAPVPPVAIEGDVVRLPLRVRNRGDETLRCRLSVRVEGEAGLVVEPPPPIEVPPGDASSTVVVLRATSAGTGALVVELSREDGGPLDAVRRPVEVVADRREVRLERTLVARAEPSTIEIPTDAEIRGDAELRLRVAAEIFGDPATWWRDDPPSAGLALALAGAPIPAALADALLPWVAIPPGAEAYVHAYHDGASLGRALGALWASERMSDEEALAILRELSRRAGGAEASSGYDPYALSSLTDPATILLALAPALRSDARPAIRAELDAVAALLRDAAGSAGALASDDTTTFAEVAAALSLAGGSSADRARADEMLRRLERSTVRASDLAWLEPVYDDGSIEPRIQPTALLALARIGRGDRAEALALVLSMVDVARGAARWHTEARGLACAAAALLGESAETRPTLLFDGRELATGGEPSGAVAPIGGPGRHTIGAHVGPGEIAMLDVLLRYAVPWAALGPAAARTELGWSGEVGPRDARSGLVLTVHHRGARVLVRPVLEIQLPAGAELDETTREGLAAIAGAPPAVEGNVLRIELRPLAPGARLSVPLRVRWAVGGSLRGLGVALVDRGEAVAVLPSRALEIRDAGAEPEAARAELPEGPRPVVPPPLVRPLGESLAP